MSSEVKKDGKKPDAPQGAASAFLPVLLAGVLVITVFQFMNKPAKPAAEPPPPPSGEARKNFNDFVFTRATPAGATESTIETGTLVARLSSRGARIERLYVESHADLQIPQTVIDASNDPIAKQYRALEITRGNGMDFNFHIWADQGLTEQLGVPSLNEAAFSVTGPTTETASGVREIRYSLPVSFQGNRLQLTKIYRFLPKESYFRQITVLRNLGNQEFGLWTPSKEAAVLFFRTFGDLGPMLDVKGPNDTTALAAFSRFYFYNEELQHPPNFGGSSGGCGLGSCGGSHSSEPYSGYFQHPNTLRFMGASSRYFFAYTDFRSEGLPALQQADGVLYRNARDLVGREAYTSFFSNFRLAPAQKDALDLSDITSARVRQLQGSRTDSLILDLKVYTGLRNDEAHRFVDTALAEREFGVKEPNEKARTVIYSNSFLALFSAIRDGIVYVMRWLHTYTGNYGWSIIIIAVAFKLITWPLNQMQAKSMKRMSALRPELESLNEKYADDPQEKQKKVMELYRKHNINPAKGCLPILIQMPVFIALYSAFSESIELWRSPFISWMTDLSAPDSIGMIPYVGIHMSILPLLMVGSQLLQQKLTTVVMDPQQKMMMYLMPLMMIFFFWSIPSGVTLYWTVQNVIAIIWQLIMNRFGTDDEETAK